MSNETKDEKKIAESIQKVLRILNKDKLNITELILFYARLGYSIGASMAGLKVDGPKLQELQQEYYKNPTVDVGMMMQGLLTETWIDSYKEKPALSVYTINNASPSVVSKKE